MATSTEISLLSRVRRKVSRLGAPVTIVDDISNIYARQAERWVLQGSSVEKERESVLFHVEVERPIPRLLICCYVMLLGCSKKGLLQGR